MEQIIDGNLCSLRNPSLRLYAMAAGKEGEILIYYSGGLFSYKFDKTVAAVPDIELKIYSLKENNTVRQAISQFQKNNSNIYVNYEIGMSGEDGITMEDAVKNLNTTILTDEGPDILILDGLTYRDYQEKGLLTDLKPTLKKLSKENNYFDKILYSFEEDGAVYAIPARFEVPLLFGGQDSIERVKDLKSLADYAEELSVQKPQKKILGIYTEVELLRLLMVTCKPAWVQSEGIIDKAALVEFLSEAKRIYVAELANITESELEIHKNTRIGVNGDTENYYLKTTFGGLEYYKGGQSLAVGKVSSVARDLANITSIMRQNPESDFKVWNGHMENVFLPSAIASVSSGSANPEEALSFIAQLLSDETQAVELDEGFPVNKKAFEGNMAKPNGRNEYFGITTMENPDGTVISLDLWWPPKKLIEKLLRIKPYWILIIKYAIIYNYCFFLLDIIFKYRI